MSEIIFGFDQNKVVNLQPIGDGCIYRNVTIERLAMLYAIKLYFYWYLICTIGHSIRAKFYGVLQNDAGEHI